MQFKIFFRNCQPQNKEKTKLNWATMQSQKFLSLLCFIKFIILTNN